MSVNPIVMNVRPLIPQVMSSDIMSVSDCSDSVHLSLPLSDVFLYQLRQSLCDYSYHHAPPGSSLSNIYLPKMVPPQKRKAEPSTSKKSATKKRKTGVSGTKRPENRGNTEPEAKKTGSQGLGGLDEAKPRTLNNLARVELLNLDNLMVSTTFSEGETPWPTG